MTKYPQGSTDIAVNKTRMNPSSAHGLRWDQIKDTYVRTGTLAGVAVGSSPGDILLPIHAQMKRCVLLNNGTVNYFLDPSDSTKKADGSASVLTGADGQVKVQVPKFYYNHSLKGNVHEWDIDEVQSPGLVVHPMFIKNGVEMPFRYVAAYEGVLYDTSAARYTNGLYLTASSTVFSSGAKTIAQAGRTNPFTMLEVGDKIVVSGTTNNNGTFTVSVAGDQTITVTEALTTETNAGTIIQTEVNWAADVLSSVSGKAPIVYGTRANFRTAAATRGSGWRQKDVYLASGLQLLNLIEFGSFYSQSMIGAGLTDWAVGWHAYNDYNPINKTGLSNAKGNTTFNVSGGDGVVGSYMTYRGIENWYGHIWKWVDGINVNANRAYLCNVDTQFADDTAVNYVDVGVDMINSNGWQSTLLNLASIFLPASVGASSSTKITDYYTQGGGWRVVRLGGSADDGASRGAFSLDATDASSNLNQSIGGRLAF